MVEVMAKIGPVGGLSDFGHIGAKVSIPPPFPLARILPRTRQEGPYMDAAKDLVTAKKAQEMLGFKSVSYLYRDKRLVPAIDRPRMYLLKDVEDLRDHGTVGQPGRHKKQSDPSLP